MNLNIELHEPTEAETQAASRDFFSLCRKAKAERTLAVQAAVPALERLVKVCLNKTGQSSHLRALLFSLWNGKPANLSDTLCLDWSLKQDFCAVLLAFGDDEFFYEQMSSAFQEQGLLEWFVSEAREPQLH